MIICKQCKKCEKCCKPYSQNSNYAEVCEDFEKKKMTNFERIKQMSIDEMAKMFFDESEHHYIYCEHCKYQSFYAPHCTAGNDLSEGCVFAIKQWLDSEVEEE